MSLSPTGDGIAVPSTALFQQVRCLAVPVLVLDVHELDEIRRADEDASAAGQFVFHDVNAAADVPVGLPGPVGQLAIGHPLWHRAKGFYTAAKVRPRRILQRPGD